MAYIDGSSKVGHIIIICYVLKTHEWTQPLSLANTILDSEWTL